MHDLALQEARRFAEQLPTIDGWKAAEIGSMDINGSLRPIFLGCEYTGYDIAPGPGVDVVLDHPEHLPVPDCSYDLVVSANTLEHTRRPWLVAQEMARVCKPGGWVFLLVPEVHPYHPYPIDCFRFYPDGVRSLMENAGLTVVECYENGHDAVGWARK